MATFQFMARPLSLVVSLLSLAGTVAADPLANSNPLALLAPGSHELHVLSPTVLELSLIVAKPPDPARPGAWDVVDARGRLQLPAASQFVVRADGQPFTVRAVGFKRRVLYAPLAKRDLRLSSCLYLQLTRPLPQGCQVEVEPPPFGPANLRFRATNLAMRLSPVLHVNQVGYLPAFPKTAMIGYYLGSLGELDVPPTNDFRLIDSQTGAPVHQGKLAFRRDVGFEIKPVPYQNVLVADFSDFTTPGEYRLEVPGLGVSFPFFIHDGVAAAVARAYALGLYHQRCGTSNALPFTRFTHGPCHTAPAEVPTEKFTNTLRFLAEATADYTNNARHVAAPLKDFRSSLYPFVRTGKIDIAGGHHDAGDYSKYTINSAALIHTLVFAVDALPGVAQLDNLGLPESGDGRSDLLQEAKWEADFLAKLQDADGGFYFLVYPAHRKYESNVLPDHGDPQIVWPKNTAATAAAVAALAQCASSPTFQAQFPDSARRYLEKARRGWVFLERAIARHGRDGAYQKLTHYGDDFLHDDELAWAACELYLATGEASIHQALIKSFDPANPATRRWGWWRLYEGYGRAIRSYACAPRSGKAKREKLDLSFLTRCEIELAQGAQDQLKWAQQSAYGTSFPTETKRFRTGGWYFSSDAAFDLAAAAGLESLPDKLSARFREAILGNFNYSLGNNPVNVCHLTGLGWTRPREIVHHYAMNDRRGLPPSGLPIGDIESGFMWLDLYKRELGAMSFPPDGAEQAPYPIYDRWGDSFNVQTEFVVVNQARALAAAAYLLAQSPFKDQPSRPQVAGIQLSPASEGGASPVTRVSIPGRKIDDARVVWEMDGGEPQMGPAMTADAHGRRPSWIEVEVQWPDGNRAFGVTNLPPATGR